MRETQRHLFMETIHREGARQRLGPHFIERKLHVLAEKQRIFHGFRHQRAGKLLKTGAERGGVGN